ncbi:hypothetical protein Aab01nite_85390 [Paractinoplanes abujensis]|nr:hypothetical protein Aab01nite_85390 [Actinoplanes abujensis]
MAAIIGMWLPAAVTAVTWAAWSDRLPDRMATHWSGTGPADGFSSTGVFWTAMLVTGVVAGLAGVVAALRSGGGAAGLRYLLGAAGALAGGAAGVWVATATATLDSPADPRLGWRLLYFVAGLAWGAVVALVVGPAPAGVQPPPASVAPLDLAPTERAAYSVTLRAPVLLASLAAAALLVAVVAAVGQAPIWPVLAVPVVGVLVFGRIRVTADRRGLRVTAGLLNLPLKTIGLAEITGVEEAEIEPLEWGGWGYRVTPARAALVLRRGPGLVVHQTDGRPFAVTLDDPRTPAALLTALVARTG